MCETYDETHKDKYNATEPWTNRALYKPPCIWSPKGFQADSFLYATTLVSEQDGS